MDSRRRAQLSAASVRPLGPHDPRRVGSYDLESKIGEGGMGSVYLGRRPGGPLVAVKVVRSELASDPAFLARFRDEVTNAERVASFCTAQVLEHGEDGGRAYMVTEYIDGPSLLQHVSENGALSPGMLNGVAVGVAAALVAIHAAGLVHRDLKPSNVLLSISGPRVIDFGIARALDVASSHTATGQVIGSPGWIAPEQILNQPVTPLVDVFAWGCLVSFAGSGRNPFGSGTFQVLAARVVHAEPDVGDLPEPLAGLVRRALDKEPSRRPSAQELLLSLVGGGGEAAVSTTLGEAWPGPLPPVTPEPVRHETPPPAEPVRHQPLPPAGPAPVPYEAPPHLRTEVAQGPPPTEVAAGGGTLPAYNPAVNETTTDPAGPAWSPPEAPTGPASPRPRRRVGVLPAVIAAVVLATAGVAGAVYALRSGDEDKGATSGGGKADPAALPTAAMLVRIDNQPGWGQGQCHASIGVLLPGAGTPKPRELLKGEGCDVLPQWSPDRKMVAFTRNKDGEATSTVWVMNADGTGAKQVGTGIVKGSRVAWSPDGKRLAAFAKDAKGVPQLRVADLDGGNERRLTGDSSKKDDPTWAAGKLGFWSEKGGSRQIYYLDPDNKPAEWTQVTTTQMAPDGANDPHWSPDGKQMAFTRQAAAPGKNDIAVVDDDGGDYQRLTENPELDMDPSWSPDGRWLAFVRGPITTPQIWAMPMDGDKKGEAYARPIAPKSVGHPAWT